ncbi:exonuclease [Nitzschia inconspicua]|uniref:Exonuclease n=1 Tax=Nitzschia inconspicua TaxID=303405 RepID=A0A9K3LNT9_9STRA|nr:exonuclease [Nitzschia inconspicua]
MRIAPYNPSLKQNSSGSSGNGYKGRYGGRSNSNQTGSSSAFYSNHHKHQPYQMYEYQLLSSSPTTVPTNLTASNTKHALIISPSSSFDDGSSTSSSSTTQHHNAKQSSNRFMAHRCVALDCEMVGVGPSGNISVLARVSVVDWYGRKIYDAFVHVEEKVTDYRTHVSGVTEQDVKGSKALNFGIVRKQVKQLLKNKIIVGHGLENDLRALKIEQDFPWYNIRDSATQYQPYLRQDQFGQWRSRRLRDLAWYHLGIVIQQEGKPHDSVEDARAAMALYRHAQPNWDYEMDCRRRNMFAGISFGSPKHMTF